jgi:hypothetical protein
MQQNLFRMPTIKTTFWLPNWVIEGLQNRTFERSGSIIRHADNKQIICWLRDQAQKKKSWDIKAVHPFLAIIFSSSKLEQLKDIELMKFIEFIHSIPELADIKFYGGKKSMGQILIKYNRLLEENSKESKKYAKEKRESIIKQYNKSYLPQLRFWLTADKLWLDIEQINKVLSESVYKMKPDKKAIIDFRGQDGKERDVLHEIKVEFEISKGQNKDIEKGKLERVGGILRKANNKEIVVWLQANRVSIPGLDEGATSETDYQAIVEGKGDGNRLTNAQLLEFVQLLYDEPMIKESKYITPVKKALQIKIIYQKMVRNEGVLESDNYLVKKRKSLLNLLNKSFLPNFQAALVRGEFKIPKKNFLDPVEQKKYKEKNKKKDKKKDKKKEQMKEHQAHIRKNYEILSKKSTAKKSTVKKATAKKVTAKKASKKKASKKKTTKKKASKKKASKKKSSKKTKK